MVKVNELKKEIAECQREICLTNSEKRKWQLRRHLRKLEIELKEYYRLSKGAV